MNCPKCGSAESIVNESRMDGVRFWVKPAFSKGDKVGATQKAQAGKVVYVDPKCRYAVLEFEGIYGHPRESFAYSDLTEQNIVREKKNRGGK